MAITCPKCGAQFDATLFQFGHSVQCRCGATVEYPGTGSQAGHVVRHDAIENRAHGRDAMMTLARRLSRLRCP